MTKKHPHISTSAHQHKQISLIEVGPRDGLQNVKDILSFDQKRNLINYLLDHGFSDVEAGSFVRPDKVPSMADTVQIADAFSKQHDRLWYLVPNLKGLKTALEHNVTQIAFFTASSETFNQKNIGMSVEKSLSVIKDCVEHLKNEGYSFITQWGQKPSKKKEVKIRIYISTVIACPYDGNLAPELTLKVMQKLLPLNPAQFSLGDTIGVGKPADWKNLLGQIDKNLISQNKIAMHCHNTHGTALECIGEGLKWGIRSFDSSIGGLGGCPFAPGAKGNLATEDLLQFLEKEGFQTGIDYRKLKDCFAPERTGKLCNVSNVF
ncbi:MAG: hypothetical protein A2048_09310 [Deltaproteobacteria bacterium GWA2_45_12]|nr:MAG: hypothetical protein A2048_09310 [Deltaproteobacteria bacterium GWA2_45_12]